MERRDVLRSAASIAAATGLFGSVRSQATESSGGVRTGRMPGPYIRTRRRACRSRIRHQDGSIDLTGRPTAKLIPGAQLKVYEGAPHGLFLTHMERLTSDLLAFAKS